MFRIEIETDNAAFADHAPSEVARILRDLADKLDHCHGLPAHVPLYDLNGNKVGFAQCEPPTTIVAGFALHRRVDRDGTEASRAAYVAFLETLTKLEVYQARERIMSTAPFGTGKPSTMGGRCVDLSRDLAARAREIGRKGAGNWPGALWHAARTVRAALIACALLCLLALTWIAHDVNATCGADMACRVQTEAP